MNRERYFTEITRQLAAENIETGSVDCGALPVLLGQSRVCFIEASGEVYHWSTDLRTPEALPICHRAADIAELVKEYVSAMETAPPLRAKALDENYLLLAEFNNVVLAGKDFGEKYGYRFATWQWDYNKEYVFQGKYWGENFQGAKENFATRSCLVDKNRVFDNEQLTELYKLIQSDARSDLNFEQEKVLDKIKEKIEGAIPDIEDNITQLPSMEQQL